MIEMVNDYWDDNDDWDNDDEQDNDDDMIVIKVLLISLTYIDDFLKSNFS